MLTVKNLCLDFSVEVLILLVPLTPKINSTKYQFLCVYGYVDGCL